MAKRSVHVTHRPLRDEGNPIEAHASLSPAERMALAWELSLQAWLFQGRTIDELTLSRDVVRIRKLGEPAEEC